MTIHFHHGGSFHTVCGRRGIWFVYTLNPEEVTCLSCARIVGVDVKARIEKEYRKQGAKKGETITFRRAGIFERSGRIL